MSARLTAARVGPWLRAVFVAVALLIVAAPLTGPAVASAAPASLFGSCENPPVPTLPSSGVSGKMMTATNGAAAPANVDPFGPDGNLWQAYGPAGFQSFQYGVGCSSLTNEFLEKAKYLVAPGAALAKDATDKAMSAVTPTGDPYNVVSDGSSSFLSFLTALCVFLAHLGFDGIVRGLILPLAQQLGHLLAQWWLVASTVTLSVMLLLGLVRSRHGDTQTAAQITGRGYLVAFIGLACATVGLPLAAAFGVLIERVFTSITYHDGASAGDAIGHALNYLHYLIWAYTHLGGNEDTIARYGPELFKACNVTRAQEATLTHGVTLDQLVTQHQEACKAAAGKIRTADPGAYYALTGLDTRPRIGWALGGIVLVGSLCLVWIYVLVWDILVIGGLMLLVVIAIAGSWLGILPRYQLAYLSLWPTAARFAVKALAFTIAAWFLQAAITAVTLNPAIQMPAWGRLVSSMIASVVIFVVLVKAGLVQDAKLIRRAVSGVKNRTVTVSNATDQFVGNTIVSAQDRAAALNDHFERFGRGETPTVQRALTVHDDVRDASEPMREKIRTTAATVATTAAIGAATGGGSTTAQAARVAVRKVAGDAVKRKAAQTVTRRPSDIPNPPPAPTRERPTPTPVPAAAEPSAPSVPSVPADPRTSRTDFQERHRV